MSINTLFHGTYTSTFANAANGTLTVPDPSDNTKVAYTLSSDGATHVATPAFTGANSNLISFTFADSSGKQYSFVATSWDPGSGTGVKQWTGTASIPDIAGKQGVWIAKT